MVQNGELNKFRITVRQHFKLYGRHELPWRIAEPDGSFAPYKILVSEIMLQQTQVPRVIPKYLEFLDRFPDIPTLASAPLSAVLKAWSGLGYNRRAKFLWQAAQKIQREFGGTFPATMEQLITLPGVGKNTAGAVLAYAFNQPMPFVETNIRTVYIYHFFGGREAIGDDELLAVAARALDAADARSWHWALMDYGSFLKQTIGNLNKLSKSYSKQPPFVGSQRQIRGQVIRLLGNGPLPKRALVAAIGDERLDSVLQDLVREAMIKKQTGSYTLC